MFARFFGRSGQPPKPGRSIERVSSSPTASEPAIKDRNLDIPNRLEVGLAMRAVPEKQPGTPRAWNVTILKFDKEGIWVARIPAEVDPLPVLPKDNLSLVLLDEEKQISYDCVVVRVKPGLPELVLVSPPTKTTQEASKMSAIGLRQHFRVNFRFPCEIRNISSRTAEQLAPIPGHTKDLSAGGMAVECKQEYIKGAELEVRVMSWNFPLKVPVRVVRSYQVTPGLFVVATVFPESLSSISKDLIAQFIAENQRGGR